MDFEFRINKDDLTQFFREVADVMARYPEVASRFVLAERGDLEPVAQANIMDLEPEEEDLIGDPPADAALRFLRARAAGRRKVCVQFGIDPRTGERVCLKWVEEG
jgi:hypothetical protein